jgi:hypothetical protein
MAKRKVNKSAKVREYLSDHPNAGPTETARALQEYGVTAALVSNIRSRKKPGRRKKRGKRVGRPRGASRNGAMRRKSAQVNAVVEAAKLIRLCGGVDEAKSALATAGQIASALK